jgi:chloramphenicol O-acetyltransferase type A
MPSVFLFFAPTVNRGKYRDENGKPVKPVSVRLNHAIASLTIGNIFL